ncbi:MAG: tetrathionate reductase family octaheme c-type cytochrome [Pseudomonadota bacterium]
MMRIFVTAIIMLSSLSLAASNPHQAIKGPFKTPMEVTQNCLKCHQDSAKEVMETSHWTWELEQEVPGRGKMKLGKKNAINNFCISIYANWPMCTSCHIGYGWEDANFDFNDQTRVDCLVCHDNTGTYTKALPGAGLPSGHTPKPAMKKAPPVNLVKVAQNVGKPTRQNCLLCHAAGGGGINVKHGDIGTTLIKPDSQLDVHMGLDGLDYNCQQCHKTKEHLITGNAMSVSPGGETHIDCTDCHGEKPHREVKAAKGYGEEGARKMRARLNQHSDRIACQTCHIPAVARETETKTFWDWSATVYSEDVPEEINKWAKTAFDPKKGTFVYQKNVVPTYRWYNRKASAYLVGDKIDPEKLTQIRAPLGNRDDKNAKIHPFKVHSGKQIYDTKHQYLITPKVFGYPDDLEAFWVNYDWTKAAEAGMKASGLVFSGEFDFAPTEMYWPLNHKVAPSKDALSCPECHRTNGRMNWQALGYDGDPMDTAKK